MRDQLLRQKRDEQLAEEPGLGAVVAVLGQMPELRERFESLEHQFDLPARAVPVQHLGRTGVCFRECREDNHVLGELQGLRLQLPAPLGGLLAQALMRVANRFSDGDTDFFQFEVREPKEVRIYTIGGVDSFGRVFASSGRWLAENDDDGDESNFRIQRVLWPGQYFVEVSGKADETGSYTLRAEGAQLSSDPIAEGGSSASIEQRFAHDYFQFEIAEASEAVIYTEGSLDTLGELLDARGNLIDGSDSGGEGSNFRMRSVLTQPGTYYVKVMAWGGSTGDYTVHLEQTALAPVEVSLSGSPQEGVIEAEDDSDYFQFEVTELTEAAIYSVGGLDSFGKLLDAEGREITANDHGGDGDNFRIDRLLWPGKYYLRVASSLSATTGSYTLHLEGTQPSITALGLDGTSSSGAITESDESDLFRIETTVPTAVMVYTSGSLDTAGSLHDSGGNAIASNDDGGEQFVNFRIAATLLRPGRYILRVFVSSGQTGSYTIHANGIAGE